MDETRTTFPGFRVLLTHALATALLAALVEQVLHEVTHGVAALLVGARWVALNLFASHHDWAGPSSPWREAVIAGSAAIVNIATGLAAVALFRRPWTGRPLTRLLLLHFGAYSVFSGFGYLMVDALFYRPGEELGDWQKVVSVLGGSWAARVPLFAIGAAGVVWGFFWLAWGSLRFVGDADVTVKDNRVRIALPLLMMPYVVVNAVFTLLALGHPMGGTGLVVVVFKNWFGFVGFFWAFFLASFWITVRGPMPETTRLPDRVAWRWVVTTAAIFALAVGFLLPTVYF